MFGIDPIELKKIKRDLTTIETALIALLSHARDTTEDEAIKGMCNTSIKGLVRCAIENTQEIVGGEENIAKKILDGMNEQKKKDAEANPANG